MDSTWTYSKHHNTSSPSLDYSKDNTTFYHQSNYIKASKYINPLCPQQSTFLTDYAFHGNSYPNADTQHGGHRVTKINWCTFPHNSTQCPKPKLTSYSEIKRAHLYYGNITLFYQETKGLKIAHWNIQF